MECAENKKRTSRAADLTDDFVVEILSLLPSKSLCRFKCVSKSWLSLISDPNNRKKLPQTLAGFFYESYSLERFPAVARHFTNVSGRGEPLIDPRLPFLPELAVGERIYLLNCCNGLLLWRHFHVNTLGYFVCNPATEQWVAVPDSGWTEKVHARLIFDPVVSSHFHVVQFWEDESENVTGAHIYSSKTGVWSHRASEWVGEATYLYDELSSVFVNGMLHLIALNGKIVAVDGEGKTWKTIPVPQNRDSCLGVNGRGFVGQSQGRLHYMNVYEQDPFKLSVWVLEDYDTEEWILKHSVSALQLFGEMSCQFEDDYYVVTIHPDCNVIFFVEGWDQKLLYYEMDRNEVRIVCILGDDCEIPYIPYVPLFMESSVLADKH